MELQKSEVADNLINIRQKIETAVKNANRKIDEIKLIAVSKTHPIELIEDAILVQQRIFGESYAQEFKDKAELAKEKNLDIDWHFIGHLQTNKVKYVVPYISTIHSVDSLKLALELQKQCEKFDKYLKILIQINISGEESKSGINSESDLLSLYDEIKALNRLEIIGLMTIAGITQNKEETITEFKKMQNLLIRLNSYSGNEYKELSMGMTGDFEEAIKYGATYIRIGTAIFGERDYD